MVQNFSMFYMSYLYKVFFFPYNTFNQTNYSGQLDIFRKFYFNEMNGGLGRQKRNGLVCEITGT